MWRYPHCTGQLKLIEAPSCWIFFSLLVNAFCVQLFKATWYYNATLQVSPCTIQFLFFVQKLRLNELMRSIIGQCNKSGMVGMLLNVMSRQVPKIQCCLPPCFYCAVFVWKRVYTLPVLAWNRVWFSRELRECMNVFIVSIPNGWERKRNMRIRNGF